MRLKSSFIALINNGISEERIIDMWLEEYCKIQESTESVMHQYKRFNFAEHKEKVLDEIVKSVCRNTKYFEDEEQSNLVQQGKNAYKYIVTALAGTIGAKYGIEVAIIYPLITLTLSWATRINIEAWCTCQGYPCNQEKMTKTNS